MEFLLLLENRRNEAPRASVSAGEIREFADQLNAEGVLLGAIPHLQPESAAVRIRAQDGFPGLVEAPFDEPEDVATGALIVDVPDRAAAIEIAKRCPHARAGVITVRELVPPGNSIERARSANYVFLYLRDETLQPPYEPKTAKMYAFTQDLVQQGIHKGGGRLPPELPGAQVERRGSRTVVVDGPFTETKEVVAGFALMKLPSRAAALELARRIPHAQWGNIEIREIK
jgi:hypothetical protein